MTKFYFVRHGESTANIDGISAGWSDVLLTEKGRQQALEVAHRIQDEGIRFDLIISSPLLRAYDTAKIIADVNDVPGNVISIVDELKEKSSGSLELGPLDTIFNTTEEQMEQFGGENAEIFRERIEEAIRIIHRKSEGRDAVLIVAHSGVYKMLQVIQDGMAPAVRMYEVVIPKNADLLEISLL